jgi:hypothetical protein
VTSVDPVDFTAGTRVEIVLGGAVPCTDTAPSWDEVACHLAPFGTQYSGKSSPHWYDARTERATGIGPGWAARHVEGRGTWSV